MNQAYEYWKTQKPHSRDNSRKIDAIALTNDEYLAVLCKRETPQARAIELIDGRVRFREPIPCHPTGRC